jgi:hypothetical protein
MSWYKVRDARVVFSGTLSRDPFTAWIATKDGARAIDDVAKGIGFRLFGRKRAARNRVWRELATAAKSDEGRSALQAAADLYARTISALAYAQGLPRSTVELRRLVLVPRTLVAGRARTAITARLQQCHAFAERPAAERDFLLETALDHIDAAMRAARPSVKRPVRAADEWVCLGADTRFAWVDQYWSGPGWSGHWCVYELPRQPLSRAHRKALERAIDQLNESLGTLSRERRQALMQLAANGV